MNSELGSFRMNQEQTRNCWLFLLRNRILLLGWVYLFVIFICSYLSNSCIAIINKIEQYRLNWIIIKNIVVVLKTWIKAAKKKKEIKKERNRKDCWRTELPRFPSNENELRDEHRAARIGKLKQERKGNFAPPPPPPPPPAGVLGGSFHHGLIPEFRRGSAAWRHENPNQAERTSREEPASMFRPLSAGASS